MQKIFSSLFFFTLLIFISKSAHSQIISGVVISAETKEFLPYVHVKLGLTGIGTITNKEGRFSLNVPMLSTDNYLEISHVSYKTKRIENYKSGEVLIVELEKNEILIEEVIIQPKEYLYSILRKAFTSIPNNYPDKVTGYSGFYKESLMTVDSLYLSVGEAKIQIFRNPYSERDQFGQVKILDSRRYLYDYGDTINKVSFYGGPYIFQWLDIVNERKDYINPKKFDEFSYRLIGILKEDSTQTFVIGFENKNKSLKNITGIMYVDKKTYAYKYFELKKENNQLSSSSKYIKRKGYSQEIAYIYYNGKWHLNYAIQESKMFNVETNKNLISKVLFHTLDIKTDSVNPIPFSEQLLYTDYFLDIIKPNGQYDWEKQENIPEDGRFLKQVRSIANIDSLSKLKKSNINSQFKISKQLVKQVRKISVAYYLGFNAHNSYNFNSTIEFKPLKNLVLSNSRSNSSDKQMYNYGARLCYFFSRQFELSFELGNSLDNKSINSFRGFGFLLNMRLKNTGRPIFIRPFLVLNLRDIGVYTGDFVSNQDFSFAGKKFDSNRISSFLGYREICINPGVEFITPMGSFINFFVSGSYTFTMNRQNYLFVKENSSLLFNKSAKVKLDSDNVKLTIDGNFADNISIKYAPFQLRIGLIFGINMN